MPKLEPSWWPKTHARDMLGKGLPLTHPLDLVQRLSFTASPFAVSKGNQLGKSNPVRVVLALVAFASKPA